MGSLSPNQIANRERVFEKSLYSGEGDPGYQTSYHSHPQIYEMFRIFSLLASEEFGFLSSVSLCAQDAMCCSPSVVKVIRDKKVYRVNLEMILERRRKKRVPFPEKYIWYFICAFVYTMEKLQNHNIAVGLFNTRKVYLLSGRVVILELFQVLPRNEHFWIYAMNAYYSPELMRVLHEHSWQSKYKNISEFLNIYKSEVFSFALLLLYICTCPSSSIKYHRQIHGNLLHKNIYESVKKVEERYSSILLYFLQMLLREDPRMRPDWAYLRIWLQRNSHTFDLGYGIFYPI